MMILSQLCFWLQGGGFAKWKKGLVVESRGRTAGARGQEIRAAGLRRIGTEGRL